ncbi:MAG: BTAD domain-containing putative transcriptional regulator [Blastocatellia bacterium]
MSQLSVRLFGKLSVTCGEETVHGLDGLKAREMLCYLLLHRRNPHPRERLAGLFWADSSTAQSKKYLRQTLWEIQRALQPCVPACNEGFFLSEAEWMYWNPAVDLWVDVDDFECAFAAVSGVQGAEMDDCQAEALRGAVQLYQGDLLEGCYQDWCVYERERLQSGYLTMLDKLMSWCEIHNDYEAELTYGHRVLRYERARECTHRRLMRLYYLAGDRTAALRQYARCVTALDEELEVKPAKRTVELYNQIRADELETVARPGGSLNTNPERSSVSSLEFIEQLSKLRDLLNKIQRQVQRDIGRQTPS